MEQDIVTTGGGSFEIMRQKIWQFLRDPEIKDFTITGWEGVGRLRITRQVVDELLKQQQGEKEEEEDDEKAATKLFDSIIWLTSNDTTMDTLKMIAESMGINTVGRELSLAPTILTSSANRSFLFILEDYHLISTSRIIYGVLDGLQQKASIKLVLIAAPNEVNGKIQADREIKGDWYSLSDDEALDLICQEVANICNDPQIRTYLSNGGDSAMQLLSYYLLFPDLVPTNETMMMFWRAEGLLKGIENKEQLNVASDSLFKRFVVQGMVEFLQDGEVTMMNRSIRSKLFSILDHQEQRKSGSCSPCSSSEGIRLRRFIVRCGLGLGEAPKADEWENDNVERIYLIGNNIKSLEDIGSHPPMCPCLLTLLLGFNRLLCKIPDDFFQNMQGLRVLDMSGTAITSLPSSLSSLINLRLLALQSCKSLETLPLHLLHALQKIEVLLLNDSPLPKLTTLSLHMMKNLFCLRISQASNLTELSLRGCHSLILLDPPANLEILDLSSTNIQDFADFKFSKLTRLSRLDLLDTKHLTVVPWHEIDRLPQMLNWDQCGDQPPAEQFEHNQGYCIAASDHEIFQFLSKDSKLWEDYFKNFKFSIVSCDYRRRRQQPKDAYTPFKRAHFIYRGIYTSTSKHLTKFVKSYHRCLEIDGTDDVPFGICGVLCHTEFFSLCSNNSIIRLSQLGVENMDNLIKCQIEKCKKMQSLLSIGTRSESVLAFRSLEYLLVFDLANLKSLCRGTFGEGSFACLKHMNLENCPRLFSLFSSSVRLEKLETLEIRLCRKLERLFEEDGVAGQDVFPQLKELCLWELGKLESICNGNLPALEKLKIHGCPLLKKLPLLAAIDNKTNVPVLVGGEKEWQKNLKWEDHRIFERVKLRVPRDFKIK